MSASIPRRRIATLAAVVLTSAIASPVSAARPVRPPAPPPPPPAPVAEPELTPAQIAASDRKVAAARAYLASVESAGTRLAPLGCVTPTTTSPIAPQACAVPQGFLPVEARDQIFGHYCGPAVGQVIANYTWAAAAGKNAFTQQQLSGWMRTDLEGGTSSQNLANGLEVATRGAPRRPSVWQWVVTPLNDDDRDGHYGDELHGFVRANVTGSKMPLAFSLKPYQAGARYHLSSWRFPVNSVGHWIAAYGWVGNYSNSNELARIYYTDSSKDEGGATGKFWDPTLHIATMIREHTRVFVW